jgi:hypothetical protein
MRNTGGTAAWLACREAGFGDVVLGPGLQNLLASPILPRGWWNQQLLLAIQEVGGCEHAGDGGCHV